MMPRRRSPAAPAKAPSRFAMSRDHIAAYYGLGITRGMPVIFDGQPGRVTGLDGQYLLVRLDNSDLGSGPLRCHPTWRMTYPTLADTGHADSVPA